MSSSQGGRVQINNETTSGVITRGYAYDNDVIRDASDWTRQLKEKRVYNSYSLAQTSLLENTEPASLEYSNSFRLQYDLGRFKCVTCLGNAIVGDVSDFLMSPFVARATELNWISVASSADGSRLVAAVQGGRIYTSTDYGVTWSIPSPATNNTTNRNWRSLSSSADGTKLLAVIEGSTFVYTSSDSGANWVERTVTGPTTQTWNCTAMSSDGVRMYAGINANLGTLWTSSDSGASWSVTGYPSGTGGTPGCGVVACSADGSKVVAGVEGGFIYTSNNFGAVGSWTTRTGPGGKSWYGITCSADGSLIAAVAYNEYIWISRDFGATWASVLTDTARQWFEIYASSDGKKLVACAGAGTPERIYSSIDGGLTWVPRESNRRWQGIATSADGLKIVAVAGSGFIYTATYI